MITSILDLNWNITLIANIQEQMESNTCHFDEMLLPLKTYSGHTDEDAFSWLSKFVILCKLHKWQNVEKCLIFVYYLEHVAWTWFMSLDDYTKSNWKK